MLNGSYQPIEIEEKWFPQYSAIPPPTTPIGKYSMVMPPPNVTGTLHIGHTMMAAVEDTLIRFKRMQGYDVSWVPGLDHAGIATQTVVEKSLEPGVTKHTLGREGFIKRTEQWKADKGGRILYQLKRLGCACDWSREAYTMSPNLSKAVVEAFCRLYDSGLVYREQRLVSWSPHLSTALSDIEVDVLEIQKPDRIRVPGYSKTVEVGLLWHFKYVLYSDPTQYIIVATSRLETMLGDVAVAVHPDDTRYEKYINAKLRHPFIQDRVVVVVADEHCDPQFGTGAVKITPAHDKNDYEIGMRHNLPCINIFTPDGLINENGGEFAGLHRFDARLLIERRLEEMDLFVSKEKNTKKMAIPICSRTGDIVEYMLLPQWYINCQEMARRAAQACRSGDLVILPEGHDKIWYHWLDNVHNWCVSRQLWWGHRIPAYRVTGTSITEECWVVARSYEEAMNKAKKIGGQNVQIKQDEDVLDTWFSSGLFPFSVYGWPEESAIFEKYFPTDVLETGSDILFFWVARMVMLSLHLTGKLPFKTVYLHPMVRDAHGKKMSKSSGNVIDPLDVIRGITLKEMNQVVKQSGFKDTEIKRVLDAHAKNFPKGIEECGADALRIGLLAYLKGGRSINLDIKRIESYRHFGNKLWNAAKLVQSFLQPAVKANIELKFGFINSSDWACRWILNRLAHTVRDVTQALESYDFYSAVDHIYSFTMYSFCDVFIELSKPRLQDLLGARILMVSQNEAEVCNTLNICFITVLKLLHPMMPFITDELYYKFMEAGLTQSKPRFLVVDPFPTFESFEISENSEAEFDAFMIVVKQFRSMLAQFEVPPQKRLDGFVRSNVPGLNQKAADIIFLAKLKSCTFVDELPSGLVQQPASPTTIIGINPSDVVDFSKVYDKLTKKLEHITKLQKAIETKQKAPSYSARVPVDVQVKDAETLKKYSAEVDELDIGIKIAIKFMA